MKRGNQKGGRRASPLVLLAIVLIFATAGTAVAALGASTFVSTADDRVATARGAQQPLGTFSATPRVDSQSGGDVGGKLEASQPDEAGEAGAAFGSPSNEATTASSSKLPFTGLLAIPVLLAGAGLLGAGIFVRRRAAKPAGA